MFPKKSHYVRKGYVATSVLEHFNVNSTVNKYHLQIQLSSYDLTDVDLTSLLEQNQSLLMQILDSLLFLSLDRDRISLFMSIIYTSL